MPIAKLNRQLHLVDKFSTAFSEQKSYHSLPEIVVQRLSLVGVILGSNILTL